jgi:hypothetical protein
MPSCDRQERISYKVLNRDIVVKASFSLLGLVDNCRFSLVIFCYLINITYLNGTSSFSIVFIEVVKMSTLHFFGPALYVSRITCSSFITHTSFCTSFVTWQTPHCRPVAPSPRWRMYVDQPDRGCPTYATAKFRCEGILILIILLLAAKFRCLLYFIKEASC